MKLTCSLKNWKEKKEKMDKVEVAELLKTIVMYYPNFKIDNFDKITNAWLRVLQNKDSYVVLENLAEHVENNVYPPVLANLLKGSDGSEKQRKYMPTVEDTRLIMLETFASREEVATEEEKREGLAKMKEILLKSGAGKYDE